MNPLLLGPLISGGASLLGGLFNAGSQASENARSRQFAMDMYRRQYADNIGLWNMQNAYNSPSAQMQRFKDAGLNPNLIYGQTNQAGSLSAPEPQRPSFEAPRWGDGISGAGLAAIDSMYNLEMKSAQVDNARAQNTVLIQEALHKMAQIADTRATTSRRLFDLDFESELRSTSADARKELLRQMRLNMDLSVRKDFREMVQGVSNYREAVSRLETAIEQRLSMRQQRAKTEQEIKNIKADRQRILQQVQLLKKEGVIKQLDADLSKQNIRPQDSTWSRYMMQGLKGVYDFLMGDDSGKADTIQPLPRRPLNLQHPNK